MASDAISQGNLFQLKVDVNGYLGPIGNELATQASVDRFFQVIFAPQKEYLEEKICLRRLKKGPIKKQDGI